MDAPARNADPLVGRLLDGRYRLDTALARGGMATVYAGTDTRLDRGVAVKVMHRALADDPQFVARFTREAQAAARLSGPYVVAVHDTSTDGETGLAYLVMEHVRGRDLRALLRESGPLSSARALDLLEPVLQGLAAAHATGLVHRDVKPENVLLGDDGSVKVADFGLARAVAASALTTTSTGLLGTPAYLAPEQVERGMADARSDVYAAGVLLWELLVGAPPYDGDSVVSVAYRHVHEDVPAPSTAAPGVPAAVDALVLHATRRDPDQRPADAGQMLQELRTARAGLPAVPAQLTRPTLVARHATAVVPAADLPGGQAGPSGPSLRPAVAASPLDPRRRRTRGRALAAVVAVLAVLLAGAGYSYGLRTPVPGVLGLTQAQATARLHAAGLGVRTLPAAFDERVAPGLVVRETPGPGGRARRGSAVALVLSKGPDRRAVPALVGQSASAARAALSAVGLRVGRITQAYSAQPVGTVVATGAPAGTRLRPGAPVDLVLSKGIELLPVPAVVGTAQDAAVAAVRAAGFVAVVTQAYSDSVPSGTVVAQDPAGGQLGRGGRLALVVSRGPQLVPVPDLVGTDRTSAEQQLQDQGLRSRVLAIPGPGIVRSQTPSAGSQVRRGTTVTLFVF